MRREIWETMFALIALEACQNTPPVRVLSIPTAYESRLNARCARPSILHIHPAHSAHSAARHAAMGMLFVLRSLGNHHLGREQQARDGCGILQRKPRDLRRIENALFEHVAELTARRVVAVGTLAGFHLVQDDRRILAGILNDISQRLFDRASEYTDADRLILIGTL